MKKVLKPIAWLVGILVLGSGTLVAFNAIDESLSPEAQKLLVERKFVLKDEDNAFFAVWGMTAAEDADPHAAGKRVVALLKDKISVPAPVVKEESYAGGIGKLKVAAEIGKLCDWAKQDCYAKLSAATERAAPLAAEHRVLLERYVGLSRYKGYEDVMPPTLVTPVPPMQNLLSMATLQMLFAIADVKRGDAAAGLNRLEPGVASARMMLGTSDELIGKMIAVAVLHRYAIVLAGLANEAPDAFAAERERVAKWLAPLSAAERNAGPALQGEFRSVHAFLRNFALDPRTAAAMGESQSSVPDWLRLRGLQVNATANLRAAIAAEEQRLALLPADELPGEVAGFRRKQDAFKDSLSGIAWRNPTGRHLAAEMTWDATEYMLRLHDLDAHLRLTALAIEIRAGKLEPEAVAGFVNSAGAPALDPYSGKPFQWDAEKRELSTAAQRKNSPYTRGGRFVIRF